MPLEEKKFLFLDIVFCLTLFFLLFGASPKEMLLMIPWDSSLPVPSAPKNSHGSLWLTSRGPETHTVRSCVAVGVPLPETAPGHTQSLAGLLCHRPRVQLVAAHLSP